MATATAGVVVLLSLEEKGRIACQLPDADLGAELPKRHAEIEALLDEIDVSAARADPAVDAALGGVAPKKRHFGRIEADHVAS